MKTILEDVKENPEVKKLDDFAGGFAHKDSQYTTECVNAVIDFYNEGYETATAESVLRYAERAAEKYTRETFRHRMITMNRWMRFLGKDEKVNVKQVLEIADEAFQECEKRENKIMKKQLISNNLWDAFEEARICAKLLKSGKATIVTTVVNGKKIRYTKRK